jgi:hypothetical protein
MTPSSVGGGGSITSVDRRHPPWSNVTTRSNPVFVRFLGLDARMRQHVRPGQSARRSASHSQGKLSHCIADRVERVERRVDRAEHCLTHVRVARRTLPSSGRKLASRIGPGRRSGERRWRLARWRDQLAFRLRRRKIDRVSRRSSSRAPGSCGVSVASERRPRFRHSSVG